MVTDRFGALIEELAEVIQMKLTPDSHGAVMISYKDKLQVYIEPDVLGEAVDLLIEIGKPGEGKYRETILREALRANGQPFPRLGTFSYGQKRESLLIFETSPMEDLTGAQLAELITQLSDKARVWRDSIARGELPPVQSAATPVRSEGFMGLR
jgi:hypothetical protein